MFKSEDPIICQNPLGSQISLKKSDTRMALELMQDENWVQRVANYYEEHYKHIGRWWELLSLQQITVGLPPLPYGREQIRSQFHVMIRGPPGTGKSTLVYSIKDVGVNTLELGVVTDAKIAGSIKDGRWVAGEAYKSKNGIMLIPELSETVRGGEHYQSAINHLIQIMEDQRITKSLSQPFEDVKVEQKKYPGVHFTEDGKWDYETNTCITVATWEMNEAKLMEKVTAGFYSRIFEIPLNYTKTQLFDVLDNIWMNISGVRTVSVDIDRDLIRSSFETMYCANQGFLSDWEPFVQLQKITFSPPLASQLIKRYKEMVTRTLRDLKLEESESAVLPTLIREPLDGFRIAVAEAVSRRFCGTMDKNGLVSIDQRAIDTACDYLRILVNRRVETYKKLTRYMLLSAIEPEVMVGDEYRLICKYKARGISLMAFTEICMSRFGVSKRSLNRHVSKLEEEGAVKRVRDPTDRRRTVLVSTRYIKEVHPLGI